MKASTAIRLASTHVRAVRHGDRWVVIGPHNPAALNGPSTESRSMTYAEAIRRCKLDRAWVALSLLDAYTESMLDAIEDYGDQPLAAIVARGFRLTVAA